MRESYVCFTCRASHQAQHVLLNSERRLQLFCPTAQATRVTKCSNAEVQHLTTGVKPGRSKDRAAFVAAMFSHLVASMHAILHRTAEAFHMQADCAQTPKALGRVPVCTHV